MRAIWSDKQSCSHSVSLKFKRIRRFSEQKLIHRIDWPKHFPHPTFYQRIEGIFWDSFSPRDSEHNPGMSKHRWNHGGSSQSISDFAARIRVQIPTKNGADFYPEAAVDSVGFFSAIVSVLKESMTSHATQNPQIQKELPNGFFRCSTLVCVAAFGCQYVFADQQELSQPFCLGAR